MRAITYEKKTHFQMWEICQLCFCKNFQYHKKNNKKYGVISPLTYLLYHKTRIIQYGSSFTMVLALWFD